MESKIFVGVVIKNYDQLVTSFLKSIENLDYNKKLITLQFNVCNTTELIIQQIRTWTKNNKNKYSKIIYEYNGPIPITSHSLEIEKFIFLGEIKNNYLKKTKAFNCDYCFIIDSDVFLATFTLKALLAKKKAIITPVLRPIPEKNDPHCNFFYETNEIGRSYNIFLKEDREIFYKDSDVISDHKNLGTWAIVGAFGAYLIHSDHIDNLNFTDEIPGEEFFALARSVKKANIDHYICNEKEFGFFIHFYKKLTIEEEKKVCLIGSEIDINSNYLMRIASLHCKHDSELNYHLNKFPFSNYLIYQIENKDLFYLDDVSDHIKLLYLKKGMPWEKQIQELLKRYTKPNTIAIDIGGHIGTHTLSLSKLVGDEGVVHVFEPQVKIFTELLINMSLNQCNNIVFHRKVLGNETKQVALTSLSSDNEGMCCVDLLNQYDQKVLMQKLDDFQLENVSIIKIDVEGFELNVIEGARETIFKNKPTIIIEIFNNNLEKIQNTLELMGYDLFEFVGENYLCSPQDCLMKNINYT